jgi:hypothetical protein
MLLASTEKKPMMRRVTIRSNDMIFQEERLVSFANFVFMRQHDIQLWSLLEHWIHFPRFIRFPGVLFVWDVVVGWV